MQLLLPLAGWTVSGRSLRLRTRQPWSRDATKDSPTVQREHNIDQQICAAEQFSQAVAGKQQLGKRRCQGLYQIGIRSAQCTRQQIHSHA